MKGRQTADIPKGKSGLVLKTAAVAIVAMLAVVCLAFLNIDSSSADPDSGECGDNVTWAYDGDHTLTISGTGEMTDYNYTPPWYNYRGAITDLVIGDGVTTVGEGAFNCLNNLENATIGSSVTSRSRWPGSLTSKSWTATPKSSPPRRWWYRLNW